MKLIKKKKIFTNKKNSQKFYLYERKMIELSSIFHAKPNLNSV